MKLSIRLKTKRPPLSVILLRACSASVATVIILMLLAYLSFAVHELGHVFFGSIGSYLNTGEIPAFATSAWDNCTGLDFIKCPQQVKWVGGGVLTGGFAIGGVLLVILVALLVALSLYKRTKNRLYLVFAVLFAVNQIAGNVVCGTDNFNGGQPYAVCNEWFISGIASLSMLAIVLLVFFIVNEQIDEKITQKSVKKWFH